MVTHSHGNNVKSLTLYKHTHTHTHTRAKLLHNTMNKVLVVKVLVCMYIVYRVHEKCGQMSW